MRVIHVVPALFSSNGGVIGGAERYALELARNMAGQVPTTLVSFGDEERNEQIGDLSVRVIGKARYIKGQRTNPLALRPLFSLLRKADVVHCHQQHVAASSSAALFCRLAGRRVFVSNLGGGGWDISSYISTDNWYHGHLHISEYSKKILGQESSPKAHVILGGVDVEKFSPDNSICKTGAVLFVGRLLPHKGINDLVAAATPDMKVEIVGNSSDEKFIADLENLAAGKNVTFRRHFDDDALVDSYRKACCIVLPSVYRTMYGQTTNIPELLGQTLLEGMACGLPGICSEVASMPEVVEDGVSGFVVPPNDPKALQERLLWLLDHPEDARKMGAAARQRVLDRFTWPGVVQRCLDIYAN